MGVEGMTPKRVVFLVLGVLLVTFFIQNAEAVPVRFLFWSMTVSRSIVLLITFALGLIVGLISGRVGGRDGSSLQSSFKD
jgi:putative membrane protein